jgi:O-antigen/teichoic acid export membrane protein
MRIDLVMLGQMVEAGELGAYGVATRMAETANFIPAIVQGTVFAAVMRNYQRDPDNFDAYMQRIFDISGLLAWLAMIGFGGITILGLEPIFGPAYASALPMTLILLLGLPFFFLYYAWGMMLTAKKWFWTIAATTGLGALANILLNFLLIPLYGARGAAAATVFAYFLAGIGASLLYPPMRAAGWRMLRSLEPIGSARRLWKLYLQREKMY